MDKGTEPKNARLTTYFEFIPTRSMMVNSRAHLLPFWGLLAVTVAASLVVLVVWLV